MMQTKLLLPLKGVAVGPRYRRLIAPYQVHTKVLGIIEIPDGYVYDGSSFPSILWPILGGPFTGNHRYGSPVHDYLYEMGRFISYGKSRPVTRKEADQVYKEIILACGYPKWRTNLAYAGLRLGGWVVWNRYRQRDKEAGNGPS